MERVVNGDARARRLVDSSHVKLKDVAVIIVVLCVASTSRQLAPETRKEHSYLFASNTRKRESFHAKVSPPDPFSVEVSADWPTAE